MYKTIILTFFSLLLSTVISAQIIQLGKVREINSNSKPVAGVQIIFEDAVPTNSDDGGKFRLVFDGKQPGDLIFFSEIKKTGYELVNQKDLEILKVSSENKLGEDFILAKVGVIDKAKKEYYEVSDQALLSSFEKEKRKLKNELKTSQRTQDSYLNQIKLLQEKYESQKESLDALAGRFARINFDDVSPKVFDAMQLFQLGEIDEAIVILESLNIEERTNQVLEEGKRIEQAQMDLAEQKKKLEKERLKQKNNIQLLMDMYLMKLEYQKVEAQYDQLVLLDSTDAILLLAAADYYLSQLKFDKAKATYIKILALPSVYNVYDDFNLESDIVIQAQISLGRFFYETNNYKDAISSFEEAIFLAERKISLFPNSSFHLKLLNEAFNDLGYSYLALNNYQKAKEFFEKSYALAKRTYESSQWNKTNYKINFAAKNSTMGYLYNLLKDNQKSLDYYELAYNLRKELWEENPSSNFCKSYFVKSHLSLGDGNILLGNYKSALKYFETAYKFHEELLQNNSGDPSIKNDQIHTCERIIILLRELEDDQKVDVYIKRQYQLTKELNESYSQTIDYKEILTNSYGLSTAFIHSKEAIEKGISYLEELIEQYNQEPNFDKSIMIIYYNKLAGSYNLLDAKNKTNEHYQLDTIAAFRDDRPMFTVVTDPTSLVTIEKKKSFDCREKIITLKEELYQSGEKNREEKEDLISSYLMLYYNFDYRSLPNKIPKIIEYREKEIKLEKELCATYPNESELEFNLAGSYESFGEFYFRKLYDRKKALDYYLIAESIQAKLAEDNPQNINYSQSLSHLKTTMVQTHMGGYASPDFIELYTKSSYGKDTTQIYFNYLRMSDSLRFYMGKYKNYNYKEELAKSLNSQAWYGIFLKEFRASELAIREGMALNTGNKYLPTNLAPALLFQGKYEAAKVEYQKWKNQIFQKQDYYEDLDNIQKMERRFIIYDPKLKTYRGVFLDDLNTFEKAGIIPEERKVDVERIRKFLLEE